MDFESIRGMSGLMFPEGPRWRDGLFWFSDILAGQIHAITSEGKLVDSFDVPGEPSGLGWLPGGDMLVVSPAAWRFADQTCRPPPDPQQTAEEHSHHSYSIRSTGAPPISRSPNVRAYMRNCAAAC